MRVSLGTALTATLPLLCLISNVNATRHRHQQNQSENSVSLDSSKSSSSSAEVTHQTSGKTKPKQRRADDQLGNLNPMLPNTSPNKTPDLMRDYLSRNMYQCSSNYIDTLSKLHALIKEAYEEYTACQEQMRNQKKTYSKTTLEALDQLLTEWKEEDEVDEGSDEESFELDSLRPPSHH